MEDHGAAVEELQDVDFSAPPADEVARMPLLSHDAVEQAARAVIQAAVEARRMEFVAGGTIWPSIVDTATGEVYTATHDGRWRSGSGDVIGIHPSETATADDYNWVVDEFTYFHERWPVEVSAMAGSCMAAKKAISVGEMSAIDDVKGALSSWGGPARDAFVTNFLNPFLSQTLINQQALLDELKIAMHAYEGILRQGRVDAKEIAVGTIAVLDSLAAEEDPEFSWSTVFGVVGAVAAVVATIASGGTAIALTAGIIAAGLGAAEVIADEAEDRAVRAPIAGHTVDEVLRAMSAALDGLRRGMDAEEDLIADLLEKQEDEIRGWLDSDDPLTIATILPNEPDDSVNDEITDLTSGETPLPDEFRPRH